MKNWLGKIMPVLLGLLLVCGCAMAEEARYEAKARVEFHLVSATENGHFVQKVPNGSLVRVLEYGDDWCRAVYEGVEGYCKTKWIYHFRSLDPARYPLPGRQPVAGFIRFHEETFISNERFQGMYAQPGQLACIRSVTDEGYVVPVWRSETRVDLSHAAFYAFADWQQAKPGDVIGGYTTFFGRQQGRGKIAERRANILLGCERIDQVFVPENETFSFNRLCAPYTWENGYEYAPNISNEGYGHGGGVCQVTTTLYNAVITLPLLVEEWSVHRYSGVDYVPHLFDAAVGKYSDFVFRNTLPYPIRVLAMPQEGMLTVLIQRAE